MPFSFASYAYHAGASGSGGSASASASTSAARSAGAGAGSSGCSLKRLAAAPSKKRFSKHFTESDQHNTCKHCDKQLTRQKDGSTASMRNHMKRQHPEQLEALDQEIKAGKKTKSAGELKNAARQASIEHYTTNVNTSSLGVNKWGKHDKRYEAACQALIEYIARDTLPLSTVEKPGFIKYSMHLQPNFVPPGRKYATSLVQSEADRLRAIVKSDIESTAKFISFTSDIWSERVTKYSFISLTAHWITPSWSRHDYVLSCKLFPERHTGEAIS